MGSVIRGKTLIHAPIAPPMSAAVEMESATLGWKPMKHVHTTVQNLRGIFVEMDDVIQTLEKQRIPVLPIVVGVEAAELPVAMEHVTLGLEKRQIPVLPIVVGLPLQAAIMDTLPI